MNELVSISELMESRKDKASSKDITERFLYSLFDSSVMTQMVERVYSKVIIFSVASDWCSRIIVTNTGFPIVNGRGGIGGSPQSYDFFQNPPPPTKTNSPYGAPLPHT